MNQFAPDRPFVPLPPPAAVRLVQFPPHPCSYLPDRVATTRGFLAGKMPGDVYHRFMDAGFRRSGSLMYQTDCGICRECVPIRVPVARFAPSKSQRRAARDNADLAVSVARPELTDEKVDLYRKYVTHWHESNADGDLKQSLHDFLYQSPVQTLEFCHRDPAGQLLAVGICDVCAESLSSVYFYFDPAHSSRSLGTAGAIFEIRWAGERNIPWYYLGFWVRGCDRMAYKSNYRPFELLDADGLWREESGPPV